jgi:hypothetical protein
MVHFPVMYNLHGPIQLLTIKEKEYASDSIS